MSLNGDDLRCDPLDVRKETLSMLLARAPVGIRLNEHLAHEDGPLVFHHACKLGLEGIVSKRRDSRYSSGRSPHWLKSKNPNAPAVKREAEEDWGRDSPEFLLLIQVNRNNIAPASLKAQGDARTLRLLVTQKAPEAAYASGRFFV